jgi:hypothetical protein
MEKEIVALGFYVDWTRGTIHLTHARLTLQFLISFFLYNYIF